MNKNDNKINKNEKKIKKNKEQQERIKRKRYLKIEKSKTYSDIEIEDKKIIHDIEIERKVSSFVFLIYYQIGILLTISKEADLNDKLNMLKTVPSFYFN